MGPKQTEELAELREDSLQTVMTDTGNSDTECSLSKWRDTDLEGKPLVCML
jgi:hypothetical protein